MISNKSRIFINTFIVNSATVIEKIIFFVINILVARYLDIQHYGEFTTALGFATFFSIFTDIGVNQTLIRAINLDPNNEKEHFGNTLFIKLTLSVVVYSVMSLSLLFTNYNENTFYLVLVFGIVRIGNELLKSLYSFYDAKEKYMVSSVFNTVFSVSFLTITWIIIYFRGNYFNLAHGRLFIVVIILIVLSLYTLKDNSIAFKLSTLPSFFKSAIPFSLYSIFGNIIQRINIIILSLMHGTALAGIFNNGFIFFLTLSFIPTNLNRVLLPFLYKVDYISDKNKFQFAFDVFTKVFSIISFYLLLIFFLFAHDIICLIFGTKYEPSISILRIIAFSIPFLFNIASTILISLERQKSNTMFMGIGAVINVIFNLFLIYFLKAEGAAIANVLTYMAIFIMCHIYLCYSFSLKMKKSMLIYLKLMIITFFCSSIHCYYLRSLFFAKSIIIISGLYIMLVFIGLIRRNDVRIVRDILGG